MKNHIINQYLQFHLGMNSEKFIEMFQKISGYKLSSESLADFTFLIEKNSLDNLNCDIILEFKNSELCKISYIQSEIT